jgi:hypothetical protein
MTAGRERRQVGYDRHSGPQSNKSGEGFTRAVFPAMTALVAVIYNGTVSQQMAGIMLTLQP